VRKYHIPGKVAEARCVSQKNRIYGNYPTKYRVIALFMGLAYTPIV